MLQLLQRNETKRNETKQNQMKQNQTQKNETESNETKQNRIRFDTIKMDAIKITRNMTNDITQWCEFIESDGIHTLEKNIRFLDRPDRKSTFSDNNLIYKWNDHRSYPLNEDELRKFTHKQGHKTPSRTEYYIMMRCKRCKFVTSYILKFQPSRYPTVFSPCKRCFVGYPLLSKWVDLASGGKARIKEDFDTFHKNNYGSSGGNTSFAIRRWRKMGIDKLLREACFEKGVVMAGGSAGAIWYVNNQLYN